MAVTPTPVFPQTPKTYTVQLTTGTGTSQATLATGGVNGTKITSVIASNSDSTANNIRIGIVSSAGVFSVIGFSSLAIGAGFISSVGNPSVDLLGTQPGVPVDNDGNPYFILGSSAVSLQVALVATLSSAGSFVNVTGIGADF